MTPLPEKENTPFPETADIETSSDNYATRFSGPVGEWMLLVQEKLTLQLLENRSREPILDVGGGHGQLAAPLCREGFPITVLGSAESCRKRIAGLIDTGKCTFQTGNVIDMPFDNQSFETVISFRLLTHCEQWPRLIEELCRVAGSSVIIDYPTNQSLNIIAPMLFEAKKKIETNTRTWTLFKHREVIAEFEKYGFCQVRKKHQFFLPMVLHRFLRCPTLSTSIEGLCRLLGMTALWGSPVIAEFERRDHPLRQENCQTGLTGSTG